MFGSSRGANGIRFASVGAVASACLVLVSGCSPLWSAPNNDPLWVKLGDQNLEFVWCGETTRQYTYLQVRVEKTDAELSGTSSFVAEGKFDLKSGQEFSILHPPEGTIWTQSGPAVSTNDVSAIFVYTGSSAENLDGLRVIYDLDRADPEPTGTAWLGANGRWLAEPCVVGASR